MIKAEDFKWLDRVYHLFHLGIYLCLSRALTDCFLPLARCYKYVCMTYIECNIRFHTAYYRGNVLNDKTSENSAKKGAYLNVIF